MARVYHANVYVRSGKARCEIARRTPVPLCEATTESWTCRGSRIQPTGAPCGGKRSRLLARGGEGPGPLEGLHSDALLAAVRVALADKLIDDTDWLAEPAAAGAALYEIAAVVPPSAEQRELGRRVASKLLQGRAETFTAIATRMALGTGKGLSAVHVRARIALVTELPLSLGVPDGPMCSRVRVAKAARARAHRAAFVGLAPVAADGVAHLRARRARGGQARAARRRARDARVRRGWRRASVRPAPRGSRAARVASCGGRARAPRAVDSVDEESDRARRRSVAHADRVASRGDFDRGDDVGGEGDGAEAREAVDERVGCFRKRSGRRGRARLGARARRGGRARSGGRAARGSREASADGDRTSGVGPRRGFRRRGSVRARDRRRDAGASRSQTT